MTIYADVENTMQLTSETFKNKGVIPLAHVYKNCGGQNVAPTLRWDNVPEGVTSFVLICDDADAVAVSGHVWDHWIVYDIPAKVRGLSEPNGYPKGINSWGETVYGGPCPPKGKKHHYKFTLYAIDEDIKFINPPTKDDLLQAIKGHVIEKAEVVGVYTHS